MIIYVQGFEDFIGGGLQPHVAEEEGACVGQEDEGATI
jgi:hypothetical protein